MQVIKSLTEGIQRGSQVSQTYSEGELSEGTGKLRVQGDKNFNNTYSIVDQWVAMV